MNGPFELSRELRAGLPVLDPAVSDSPGAGDPSRPVRIVRAWREPIRRAATTPGQIILRLDLPRPRDQAWWHVLGPPDLALQWLGVVASSLYGVLEQEPLDYDDGFTHYVARLLPTTLSMHGIIDEIEQEGGVELQLTHVPLPPRLVPIHQDELRHVEHALREAVTRHPTLTDDDLRRLDPLDVTDFGSDRYYDQCLQERKISAYAPGQCLWVGPGSLPNRRMLWRAVVAAIERPAPDRVTLTVCPPGEPEITSTFEVRAHVPVDGGDYLAIAEPDAPGDAAEPVVSIVRVAPGEIFLVDREPLRRVVRRLIDALEEGRRGRVLRQLRLPPGARLDHPLALLRRPSERPAVVGSADIRPSTSAPSPTPSACRECRVVLEEGASFCGYCGAPVA